MEPGMSFGQALEALRQGLQVREVTVSEGDEYCWHCGQKLDWEEDDD